MLLDPKYIAERVARTEALLRHPLTIITRPVWIDGYGDLRLGRGDTAAMLEHLGVQTRS
jgi:ribosomal protein L13E